MTRMRGAVIVTVTTGAAKGERLELRSGDRILIGRVAASDFRVNDSEVSRRHCVLTYGADGVSVEDLGSANGTFVNGCRLEKTPAALGSGDRLALGAVNLSVVSLAETGDPDAAPTVIRPAARLEDLSGAPTEEHLPAPASPPAPGASEPPRCQRCDRKISMATFASGDVLEIRGRFICPQCRQASAPAPSRIKVPGYEITGSLGSGGMGAVYEAVHSGLARPCAIKILALHRASVKRHVDRFLREGRVLAGLDHPNIVRVYDLGESEDSLYIAMELVRGKSLDVEIIEGGPVPVKRGCALGQAILKALEYAHERKIVHRDIKPQNVLLSDADGAIKLADFGFAKNFEEAGLSGITRAGASVGTLAYMAPEQVRDSLSVDHRADLYSVGATLFVALTGLHFLPAAETQTDLQRLILNVEAATIRSVRPEVPVPLSDAIARSLAKRPEDRFPSAKAFLSVIEAYL